MSLLRLIRSQSNLSPGGLLAIATLAGLSNALILVIVNVAAGQGSNGVADPRLFAYFVLTLCLYVLAQRHLLATSTREIERILDRIRTRIADQIRGSELLDLDRVGRAAIYASVGKDTLTVSQAASTIVIGAQSAILILFTALYLASLSRLAFLLTLGVAMGAYWIHRQKAEEVRRDLHAALIRENDFVDVLTHLLDGFKEVRLSRERSADLFAALQEISDSAARIKIRAQRQFTETYIFSQLSFYVLIGAVVLVLPRLLPTYSEVLTKATAAILFIIGPIGLLVGSVPVLAAANAAVENIEAIEKALARVNGRPPAGPAQSLDSFERIELRGVSFHYVEAGGETPFSVGPLDLTIPRGEVLFIVGGNGSGKSTLLRLLTALYPPTEGSLALDGIPIGPGNRDAYRSLFSAIFWDYHLFDRLYGLREVDPREMAGLLERMRLADKIRLADGRWNTLDLSTGQKKRLALVVSLLEDRPICVFDEWAADQDPDFRRYFYEELLPRLKAQGKTVLAVTHDDRYFHAADRVLQMEDGRITSIRSRPSP